MAHGEAAVRVADGIGGLMDRAWAYYALGRAYHARTDWGQAIPWLERALEAARTIHLAYGETLIVSQLGTTCVEAGRVPEAAAHATRALSLARQRGERGEEAWALLLHGDVAARAEPVDVDGARAWYAQALALGEVLGMRPLAARCRLAMGELERRAGRPDAARPHFAAAYARLSADAHLAAEEPERLARLRELGGLAP